ncbi:hypothetical protein [Jiangella asiatica]|uniref:Uncharacterized protein n=1 Tax=Jiangella asiatica TaxID=2530372 RepID=A0A4R5CSM8_9ACTN|nr:hypothetical protein [Jiangella asiatica]TDE02567.1 hypothetical protein E1269_21520 [Jiangella asiatica]
MSGDEPARESDPSDDGALFRAASRRADDVDDARSPAERGRAWARFVPTALSALAEGFLRDSMVIGTATFSLIIAVAGLLSGDTGKAVVGVVAGVGGAVLVVAAVARRWPTGRQWLTIAVVLVVEVGLIAAWLG